MIVNVVILKVHMFCDVISCLMYVRHGSQIRLQLSAASPKNRPQPKVIIILVIIKLKLWPAAGCEATVAAELSSRPLVTFSGVGISDWDLDTAEIIYR